jgi:hypothetical protein
MFVQTTTFGALEELGRHFTYNLINAQGDYVAVKDNIKKEMEYQSRLELNPETHAMIRYSVQCMPRGPCLALVVNAAARLGSPNARFRFMVARSILRSYIARCSTAT